MTDKKLISSLQGLRAVAFLCVVISHCGAPWLGPWAISVFVALSGFLMVCNYYDRPRTAPGLQSAIAFSFKKIRRLYVLTAFDISLSVPLDCFACALPCCSFAKISPDVILDYGIKNRDIIV